MIELAEFALALLLFLSASPQNRARPDVPEKLAAPATEDVVLQAHASGSQIYVCQAGTDQKLFWTLKAPEAQLLDARGTNIGSHYAGRPWKHNDGSELPGKLAVRQDAPDPAGIPWLLLTAAGHSG